MLCYTGSTEKVLVVALYWVFQYIRTDWTEEVFIDWSLETIFRITSAVPSHRMSEISQELKPYLNLKPF
jgi:hypothetical protein